MEYDKELYEEFAESMCDTYIEFLQSSLEIQQDILAQEPREADLTLIYINVLEEELAKVRKVLDAEEYEEDFEQECFG